MRQAMEIAKLGTPIYETISLPEWADAARVYAALYRECGSVFEVCSSCFSTAFGELVERYQPKWHVHSR
jgi:hypothetical protein